MNAYTLKTLDAVEKLAPGSLSSLVFNIPFPDNVPRQLSEQYEVLRTESHMEDESHYEEASGRLALEVYNQENIAQTALNGLNTPQLPSHEIVQSNKSTLRHIELILPTGGIATPLNLLAAVKDIAHLESFCIQWPLRGYRPLTLFLMSDWAHIIEDSITTSFADFHAASSTSSRHTPPPSSGSASPFPSQVTGNRSLRSPLMSCRSPTLPALELLDLTHWSPTIPALTVLLAPGGPLPALQHLIIDHGTEISSTDFDDDDDGAEVGPDYDYDAPQVEKHSWRALGAFLAAHPTSLRSLSAALHDARFSYAPAYRLDKGDLVEMLREGAGNPGAVKDLVVCTAWPIRYEANEPRAGETHDGNSQDVHADLYAHAPGCGHLAYPPDQRPTTGLWPAQGAETRAIQMMAGRPWY